MLRCQQNQLSVFLLTFCGYAAIHAMRTSWSYSKKLLQGHHGNLYISNSNLGITDAVFMLCYCFGLAFIAPLGDHYNRRRFLVFGYVVCLLGYLLFPTAFHFFGIGSVLLLILAMGVSGIGSAFGFPGSMGILEQWFKANNKGLIIGLWAGCQPLGNILGLISSTVVTQYLHLRWEYNFFWNGLVTAIMIVLITLFLKEKPYEDDAESIGQAPFSEEQNLDQPSHGICKVLRIPRVIPYVIAFACLKASMYGLLFWFPKYIFEKGMTHHSGLIPSMFEVGTFIGGILLGHIGDRMEMRSLLLAPFIFFSSLMMLVVIFFLNSAPAPYFIVILLMGIGLGGPYNIIGSVVAIDLATQSEVRGNKKIVSTITGVVDACGSLFAALTQLLLAHISHSWIFVLFTGYSLVAAIALIPITLEDFREYKKQQEVVPWYLQESRQAQNGSRTNN